MSDAYETLKKDMPSLQRRSNYSDSLKMEGQMNDAQFISDMVPRRQEDHPANSQKYKQIHEDE